MMLTSRAHLGRVSAIALAISSVTATGAYGAGTSQLMEEVIVTAEKRAESVQDVSASITAVGQEMIDRAGIVDITRLEHIVPGMRMGLSGNEARIAMRGARTNNVGTEAEQVVGVFIDGVYVPTTTQALNAYVDLERIEVLRGPQGTLYGRNTFGGAINVLSNEPEFEELTGSIEALVGDYNRERVQGVLNVPVTDTFAVRLAYVSDVHNGYVKNHYHPSTYDDLDDQDSQFLRVTAKWQVTDNLDILVRYADAEKDNNSTAIWGYQFTAGYENGQFIPGHPTLEEGARPDEGPHDVYRNFPSAAVLDDESITLAITWDFSFATAKLTYNDAEFEGIQYSDFDYSEGGPAWGEQGDWAFLGWNSSQESDSFELQLVSNTDGPLQWVAGIYQFEQDADWGWISSFDGVLSNYGYGHNLFNSKSEAVYGHATWSFSDDFRVVGGLRSNEDTKGKGAQEDSWKDTLWKAGMEYNVNDDMMVYFTASTGFRAGGFNSSGVVDAIAELDGRDISSYDPEEVDAYEIGLKSSLLDGKMTLNVAAFRNEYTSMHAQSFFLIPGETAVSEYTENGGEVDAQGIEVEMQWAPTDRWYVSFNMALLDAEFGTYDVAAMSGLGDLGGRQDDVTLSLEGWEPANSPEITAGLQVSYDFDLGNFGYLTPMLQSTYTSDYYAFDVNVRGADQDSHTKSDLRLIWNYEARSLKFEAYVLNLEDEAVMNRAVISQNSGVARVQVNWNQPRTWGVSARYEF